MRTLLLIVSLFVFGYAWSNEPTKQNASERNNAKTETTNSANDAKNISLISHSGVIPVTNVNNINAACDENNKANNEECQRIIDNSEYTIIYGHKIKITDGLLVLFTAFLVLVTAALIVVGWIQACRLQETIESNERMERAYLFLEKINVERREPPDVPNAWYICLKFKNVGRTPAIIKEYIANIKNLAELPEIPSYDDVTGFEHINTLAPQKGFWTRKFGPGIPSTPDGYDIRYIVYGRLIYEDTQGGLHKTGFALEVSAHLPMAHQHNNSAYNYHT